MEHRTLQMNMPFYESGGEILAVQVNHLPRLPVVAHSGNPVALDSHVPFFDLRSKGVHYAGIGEKQVGRRFPPRDGDQTPQVHYLLQLQGVDVREIAELLVPVDAVTDHEP